MSLTVRFGLFFQYSLLVVLSKSVLNKFDCGNEGGSCIVGAVDEPPEGYAPLAVSICSSSLSLVPPILNSCVLSGIGCANGVLPLLLPLKPLNNLSMIGVVLPLNNPLCACSVCCCLSIACFARSCSCACNCACVNPSLDDDVSASGVSICWFCWFNLDTLYVEPPKFCFKSISLICLSNILFCCSFSISKWSKPSKKLPSGDALNCVALLSGSFPVRVSFSGIKFIISSYVGRLFNPYFE